MGRGLASRSRRPVPGRGPHRPAADLSARRAVRPAAAPRTHCPAPRAAAAGPAALGPVAVGLAVPAYVRLPEIQAGPVQSGHLPKMASSHTMTSKGTRSHGASTARNSCNRSSW